MHPGRVLRSSTGRFGSLASFPPPPQAELCASRGETWALQSILGPAACPRLRTSWRLPGLVKNLWRPSSPPGARAAGGDAEGSERRLAGPNLAGHRCSPPLPYCHAQGPAARAAGYFTPPQTASLGDDTACAVPLKAVGSVLLSFSTGCQNMQIRGPESAAKSRRRRGAAGASPDPLLVWLFPAWPAAPRPSQQPPGPLPRPAGLTLPPTPPGRPLAPPQGGNRGRETLLALIPAGAGTAAELSCSPRRAGGGEPGGAVPPRYRCGEPGGSCGRGGGEGARGRRESLLC